MSLKKHEMFWLNKFKMDYHCLILFVYSAFRVEMDFTPWFILLSILVLLKHADAELLNHLLPNQQYFNALRRRDFFSSLLCRLTYNVYFTFLLYLWPFYYCIKMKQFNPNQNKSLRFIPTYSYVRHSRENRSYKISSTKS